MSAFFAIIEALTFVDLMNFNLKKVLNVINIQEPLKLQILHSVTQILREINFRESRSSKSAFFAILEALIFVDLMNFSLLKVQNVMKNQHSRAFKCVKMADSPLQESPKLISRKIWMMAK